MSSLDKAKEQQAQMAGRDYHRPVNGLEHARNLQPRSSVDVYKTNRQQQGSSVSRSRAEHEPWVEAGSHNKNNFRIPRKPKPPPNNNTKNQPIDLCDGDNSQTEPERSRGSSLDTTSSHDDSNSPTLDDDSRHNTSTSTTAAAVAKKRRDDDDVGGEDLVDSDDDVAKRKKRRSPDSNDDRKVAAKSQKGQESESGGDGD